MRLQRNQIVKIAKGTRIKTAIIVEPLIETLESKNSFTCLILGDNFISTYPQIRILSIGKDNLIELLELEPFKKTF